MSARLRAYAGGEWHFNEVSLVGAPRVGHHNPCDIWNLGPGADISTWSRLGEYL